MKRLDAFAIGPTKVWELMTDRGTRTRRPDPCHRLAFVQSLDFFKSLKKAFDSSKISTPSRRTVLCNAPPNLGHRAIPVDEHANVGKPTLDVGRSPINSQIARDFPVRR